MVEEDAVHGDGCVGAGPTRVHLDILFDVVGPAETVCGVDIAVHVDVGVVVKHGYAIHIIAVRNVASRAIAWVDDNLEIDGRIRSDTVHERNPSIVQRVDVQGYEDEERIDHDEWGILFLNSALGISVFSYCGLSGSQFILYLLSGDIISMIITMFHGKRGKSKPTAWRHGSDEAEYNRAATARAPFWHEETAASRVATLFTEMIFIVHLCSLALSSRVSGAASMVN